MSISQTRRKFLGAAVGIAATATQRRSPSDTRVVSAQPNANLVNNRHLSASIKHVNAGRLKVEFAEMGPASGAATILLHGWPYDIHSYADVAPALAAKGHRVIVPFLCGFGGTRFLSADAVRNGQPAAMAMDVVDLMDALAIDSATIGGFDWGARSAAIVAALWPERVRSLVSVSGYLIGSQATGADPLPPLAEYKWWYQFYFATERGRRGYERNRQEFARLIWELASPRWAFDAVAFELSARALENPDHVAIVMHNYRWRLGLEAGEPRYDAIEAELSRMPPIIIPSITLEGDANGAPHPEPASYANKFTGPYVHRLITGGVGHNLPQEAPQSFVNAVLDSVTMQR